MSPTTYTDKDRGDVREVLDYPNRLNRSLQFLETTASVVIPANPIDRVVFQDDARKAVKAAARNRGNILLIGKPGVGKSMLANMFEDVMNRTMGDYLRQRDALVAIPGRDRNRIKVIGMDPPDASRLLDVTIKAYNSVAEQSEPFSMQKQINEVRLMRNVVLVLGLLSMLVGLLYPYALVVTGVGLMGALFLYLKEKDLETQEKVHASSGKTDSRSIKELYDMLPEMVYDPRQEEHLLGRVSEPSEKSMKGGFRWDPYQSGGLGTPAHKRAFVGALSKYPIIYVDELKTLIKNGFVPDLLEIMQNGEYRLEGGKTGSSADSSQNMVPANFLLFASCNHDTYRYLVEEGEGALLSRFHGKGRVVELRSEVAETPARIRELAQYIKQEIETINEEFNDQWGEIIRREGHEGVRRRNIEAFGRVPAGDFRLEAREFARDAIAEMVKELRSRASNGRLSAMLRPLNGIIREAEMDAITENSPVVTARHVAGAIDRNVGLEGALMADAIRYKRELKDYLETATTGVGYVVGLAVFTSAESGQMYGTLMPIKCQVLKGNADVVTTTGRLGEIAKESAQNVRAYIKRLVDLKVPLEMHIQYIQTHSGVEGDSASIATDIGLLSDLIQVPISQKHAITGSLVGNVVVAVGGVTAKLIAALDREVDMDGACIPWQNRKDVEPLLLNAEYEEVEEGGIPGVRIFRESERQNSFDVYFVKTRYDAYRIMLGLTEEEIFEKLKAGLCSIETNPEPDLSCDV